MPDLNLNDNLALQSLRVAQQIDRRSTGEFQASILSDFGKSLSHASGTPDGPMPAFLWVDPIATEVFSEAVQETSNQQISDMRELVEETSKIIASLVAGGQGLTQKDFERVKAFCLALHKSIMARRLPPLYERLRSFTFAVD